MLKRIASRVDGRTGVIAIEASDPVPYVASQPDPRTFVVELRDVVAAGFADGFTADPRNPIAAVQVESAAGGRRRDRRARAPDAQPADAAARAQLAQRHLRRGRSASMPTPSVRPASSTSPVRRRRFATCASRSAATPRRVTLLGTARLVDHQRPGAEGRPAAPRARPANVTSALPSVTTIEQGPVDRVRIGLEPDARRW